MFFRNIDPWVDMSGVIERGNGKFNNKHVSLVDIQYTIWYVPASLPNEKHSWGGLMVIPSLAEFIDLGSAEITTEDGRKGNILLSSLQGNTVTFLGTGSFPT